MILLGVVMVAIIALDYATNFNFIGDENE